MAYNKSIQKIKNALKVPTRDLMIGNLRMIFFQIAGETYYIKIEA